MVQAQTPSAQQTQTSATQPVEVYVWGEQPTSAATEQTRWARDLELRPSNTPSDVLQLTPGLLIGQNHGGGKADQILFRGFDSDHGTDFAIFVDGIPVNMVSHAHGQGYADMHWLIPETVDRVEIYKGPYFAHLGDFATSGAMNIVTKRRDRDSTLMLSGGRYNTQRYIGIFSPPESTILRPYIAGEVYHNDGPFKNENNYIRYNILAKLGLLQTANSNLSFLGTFFKTAWGASGEIPARAVRGGEISRFGSFDPSEGGKSQRQNLSLIYSYADANQAFNVQTWVSWYQLQLWSNFSLFFNDDVNGDGIEQRDKRFLAGNNINYWRNYSLWNLPMETLVGFQSRFDHIRVGLFNQTNRRRRETVQNNYVDQTNLGWFVQQEIRPTSWLRTQIGARMGNFWFKVNQIGEVTEPIAGNGSDTIVNPKLNFIFTPFSDNNVAKSTNLFLNLGGGFHSNDARVFVQDPKKEIPRYWGGEVGTKTRLFERLDATFSYWRSYLESELVFVGDEGTFEPAGPSNRHGVETEPRYDILPWLTYDIDLSYTWARFTNGNYVPLAPRFQTFTGITARHPSGIQARLQMRHVGQRYGIEDGSIKVPPATVFDLFLKYVWKRYEFFVEFLNLANTKWRAAEHVFESRTAGEVAGGLPGRLDAHYTPGDPFTVKAGVRSIYGKRVCVMKPLTLASPRWPSWSSPRKAAVKNETLSIAFLISIAVHLSVILIAAVVVTKSKAPTQELLLVNLIDAPRRESPPTQKIEAPTQPAKPLPPSSSQLDSIKERAAPVKATVATTELMPAPLPPVPANDEPAKKQPPRISLRLPELKAAAAKPALETFSAKATLVACPDRDSLVEAAAPRLLD